MSIRGSGAHPPSSVLGDRREVPEISADVPETLDAYLIRASLLASERIAFTFVDFDADALGHRTAITWAELDQRVEATARTLVAVGATGERVAVVAPQGLEYVVGFLAALRARAIAVPLFAPHLPGHDERLVSALDDSAPVCLLTTPKERESVRTFCAKRGLPGAERILAIGGTRVSEPPSGDWGTQTHGTPRPEDCAYLQYTSGSTSTPTGVEITHANVVANVRQAVAAYGIDGRNQVVSWLPLFHDMGLVLALAIPVVGLVHSVIMDPAAFVRQPARWLRLVADHPGAITAAPNFAYDYCVRRVPEELRGAFSLQEVSVMINGSEPIKSDTVRRFQNAFGSSGLNPRAVRPSYGLAEATVFVATSRAGELPCVTAFDRALLGRGVARPVAPAAREGAVEIIACGEPVGQDVAVVDTQSRRQPDGSVGEIWVRGPNVARGYWRCAARSADIFGAALTDPDTAPADGPWLRTGDLGVVHDGRLYITGRIKDLVIIDGTNHYPHDIEATVQDAHGLIRPDHVAAFSLTVDGDERLVVVAEHARFVADPDPAHEAIARAVRRAIVTGHGVSVHDFVLAPPGAVPRTSSGKVSRDACRRRYLDGVWGSPSRRRPDLAGAGGDE
ncbi:long chain fatty acid CoA FadD26 [Actinacidiphila yanglinensis]|uniref:Long chain fatty acid CoA FadD26 n=1 Tax=Actinacidiphila yanglinensis TaxID=310779 RepID=A0A1H6EAN1_9ACTN|nr:fatty acyl-AMP ligase [Actinacidiphila yanglinensis]SEG93984.1 long chain fatty acid CoA FadD26 [Actinacidiphila yanglinensis]